MKPYWQDDLVTLLHGDCRQVMAGMEAESVSCICCSPPFWGLRSYTCEATTWANGWKGQLGLEPSVAMYVAHTIEWLRACGE